MVKLGVGEREFPFTTWALSVVFEKKDVTTDDILEAFREEFPELKLSDRDVRERIHIGLAPFVRNGMIRKTKSPRRREDPLFRSCWINRYSVVMSDKCLIYLDHHQVSTPDKE